MTIARHVRVTGLVQGVFFRAWTKEQADELGVTGWVRNCRDGSVEAQIEGDAQSLDQLVDRLRRGPPSARVEDLQAEEVQPDGSEQFDVRH
jgi:acylphosphatase